MGENSTSDLNEPYIAALRIIYFVISIFGLIFSSTLLIVLGKKLRKNTHSDLILTIFAVSVDCIASGGLLFRAIFTQYPYNILKEHSAWCSYDSFVNSLILSYSGYILSILSVQRMLLIVFNIKISIFIWLFISFILALLVWVMAVIQILNNNIVLSIVEVFCIGKNNNLGRPHYITLMVMSISTYLLTIVSYLSIIMFSCKQCLNQLNLNLDKSVVYRECRIIIFKSLLFLIPYMVIYSGRVYCWLYEFLTGARRTWNMEYISVTLISMCVVVNCSTVLYMNKEVNKDFLKFLSKLKSAIYQ
jgi:hypothetical protein